MLQKGLIVDLATLRVVDAIVIAAGVEFTPPPNHALVRVSPETYAGPGFIATPVAGEWQFTPPPAPEPEPEE